MVNILSDKQIYFYIQNEPIIDEYFINLLLPISKVIYVQNNIYYHPKIKIMPIGIRDCGDVLDSNMHDGFSHNFLYNEQLKTVEKSILCLLCFTLHTGKERQTVYNIFKDKPFITDLNSMKWNTDPKFGIIVDYESFMILHIKVYFLYAHMVKELTHIVFWECLYLNTIPIVKLTNTVFDKIYYTFPCFKVNNWNEINEELLLKNKKQLQNDILDFNINNPNFNIDHICIQNIIDKYL